MKNSLAKATCGPRGGTQGRASVWRMCMACMAGAMTAGSAVTGGRTWLAAQPWMTPRLLRRATISLLVAGLAASSTVFSGAEMSPRAAHAESARTALVRGR